METPLVRYEVDDGVAIVSLNRPQRHNAVNDEMGAEWHAAILRAIHDASVGCILLRGEGPSFCSGRDTADLGRRASGENDFWFVRHHQDVRLALLDAPKGVVAAIHGWVLGGGLETALAADLRVAATDTRMGFPEIGFGLVADTGGTQLASVLAEPSRAKWLLMSGEPIDASQALAWGLVDWVVPREELDERALAICRRIATAPRTAVAIIKQLVDQFWLPVIRNGIRQELLAQTTLFAVVDRKADGRVAKPGDDLFRSEEEG
jgi:enoyl-CoA hydratase/carnithine racemase